MATRSVYASMLNQKPVKAPGLKGTPAVKVQKPPGTGEFAYLSQGNSLYRHPMENRGNDVSGSVWARMLGMKTKGVKNV
jgi:hypothetical protein